MEIRLKQAQALVEAFGGDDDAVMILNEGDGHSGHGLYVYSADYPDEGSIFLGSGDESDDVEHP